MQSTTGKMNNRLSSDKFDGLMIPLYKCYNMIIFSQIAEEWVQLLKPNPLKKPTVFGEFIIFRTF
jgi:hypothetical protein